MTEAVAVAAEAAAETTEQEDDEEDDEISPSDMIYPPLHRLTVHKFSLHDECVAVDRHFPLLLFDGNTAFAGSSVNYVAQGDVEAGTLFGSSWVTGHAPQEQMSYKCVLLISASPLYCE